MKNQINSPQKNEGVFRVFFNYSSKITKEIPENSLQGLCNQLFSTSESLGDPVIVQFPDGNEYFWGEKGMWLAHQFAAEGTLTEEQFVAMLSEYNNEALVMAKKEVEVIKSILLNWKEEIRLCEQRTQEAIAGHSNTFEMYMRARRVLHELESDNKS